MQSVVGCAWGRGYCPIRFIYVCVKVKCTLKTRIALVTVLRGVCRRSEEVWVSKLEL